MEIVLTDKAKDQIQLLEQNSKGNKMVRINITSFGWAGPTYGVVLDELKDDDVEVSHDNLNFIFEKVLYNRLKKVEIDYMKLPFFSKFVVNAYQS